MDTHIHTHNVHTRTHAYTRIHIVVLILADRRRLSEGSREPLRRQHHAKYHKTHRDNLAEKCDDSATTRPRIFRQSTIDVNFWQESNGVTQSEELKPKVV